MNTNNKSYQKTVVSVIKSVLKSKNVKNRPNIQSVWFDSKNRVCFTNGHVAFRLNKSVSEFEGFAEIPQGPEGFMMDAIFTDKNCGAVTLPPIEVVKNLVSDYAHNHTDHERRLIHMTRSQRDITALVNAEYLLMILKILPDATACEQEDNINSTIRFTGELGEALLLPIHQNAPKPEPKPAPETASEQPATETVEEQPAPDPKQAHAPVPEKTFIGSAITGKHFKIVFDGGAQRTRIYIPAEYRERYKSIVEEAGFYFSPNMDTWNKKLTFKAYRAAVALSEKLDIIAA